MLAPKLVTSAPYLDAERIGSQHPVVAETLNSLANVAWATGAKDRSEELYLQALKIEEHALGSEHPSVAMMLTNLARLRLGQGEVVEAEALYRRALQITERIFGLQSTRCLLHSAT